MTQFLRQFIKFIFILYFIYDMVLIVGKIHTEINQSLMLPQSQSQSQSPNQNMSNYTDTIKINNHVNLILF
uniref:Uncharacterized protein n=1 Tax=viral metagenome TaxID=1070528 RepID=A0A6C0HY84_9ZZZZ